MKASDLFVKCLESEGVTRIYGVPGEENADFMLSMENSSIEFVLTRHEQGAAFMASVHGRLTGEVGVCLGTLLAPVRRTSLPGSPMAIWTVRQCSC